MILSVSRRTDIPAFYSEWFMNRIEEGKVYVRNPFNTKQVSNINIKPDVVDCIIFWTKNATPLMKYLPKLDEKGYKYYFQYTITPYHDDLEKCVGNKKDIIKNFIELSEKISKDRVILRYDPIILSDEYTIDYHEKAFKKICKLLHQYTNRVIISFLDDYKKTNKNMKAFNLLKIDENHMKEIADRFVFITKEYGLKLETCAEGIDLDKLGIKHAKCIDGDLIEKIIDYEIQNKEKKDANREYCGCMKCIDVGQYDTCIHNCLYCYANTNKDKVFSNYKSHNPESPILLGDYDENKVTVRKDVKSYKIKQDNLRLNNC